MAEQKSYTRQDTNVNGAKKYLLNLAKNRGVDGLIAPQTEDSNILKRFTNRHVLEQIQEQRNVEQIIAYSLKLCQDQVGNTPDADWLTQFLKMACTIQNKSMQQLWGKILTLEMASAGSFSIKTLKTLKEMTQREASSLHKASSLSCLLGGDKDNKIITGVIKPAQSFGFYKKVDKQLPLNRYGFGYAQLMQLVNLGIIYETELESNLPAKAELPFLFGNMNLILRAKFSGIKVFYYRFSPIGNELIQLLGQDRNNQYQDDIDRVLKIVFRVTANIS